LAFGWQRRRNNRNGQEFGRIRIGEDDWRAGERARFHWRNEDHRLSDVGFALASVCRFCFGASMWGWKGKRSVATFRQVAT